MVTKDYGFDESIIAETTIIDKDKHGFIRKTVKDADIQGDDVVFFDYDGTILHSYKADAFLRMPEMPKNPEHDGLISRGWNWSYEDAQAYVQKYGKLNVGQMYAPADGKTHIKIHIPEDGRPNFKLCFTQTVANGVIVDWGDGSETDTSDVTDGLVYMEHTYAKLDMDYEITLKTINGCEIGYGFNDDNNPNDWTSLFNKTVTGLVSCEIYVTDVIISNFVENITLGAFRDCVNLHSLIISDSVKNIESRAFYCCRCLRSLVIPNSVEVIGSSSFFSIPLQFLSIPNSIERIETSAFRSGCYIQTLIIPDSVTSIGETSFQSPNKLQLLIIPDSVTSIERQAFENCEMLTKCIIKSIVPPTLGIYVFRFMPEYAKIFVPAESVDAYKTATNWSAYADHIFAINAE